MPDDISKMKKDIEKTFKKLDSLGKHDKAVALAYLRGLLEGFNVKENDSHRGG